MLIWPYTTELIIDRIYIMIQYDVSWYYFDFLVLFGYIPIFYMYWLGMFAIIDGTLFMK